MKTSEVPRMPRRDFLKLVRDLALLSALNACGGDKLATYTADLPGAAETVAKPEIDRLDALRAMLSDPLALGVIHDSTDELNPLGILLTSNAIRISFETLSELLPASEKERFLTEIGPLLQQHRIGIEEISQAAVIRRPSPAGDVYFLNNPAGRSFYLRFTPNELPDLKPFVEHGLNLQRNYYSSIGAGDKIITALENISDQSGRPSYLTVVEDLGLPITAASNFLTAEQLNTHLERFFAETIVTRILNGYVKRDVNGGGSSNIVFDLEMFKKTGEVKFYEIDFAEKPVIRYVPEAAVADAYARLQKLVITKLAKHGVTLASLESILQRYNISGLNPTLLSSEVITINVDIPQGSYRLLVPGALTTGGEAFDRSDFDALVQRLLTDGTVKAPNGTTVTVFQNQIAHQVTRTERVISGLRTGAKWVGRASVIADVVGFGLLVHNAQNQLFYEQVAGNHLQPGTNSLNLEYLLDRSETVKYNLLTQKQQPLGEVGPLTHLQIQYLQSVGLQNQDFEQLYMQLAGLAATPIGLINENVAQGVWYTIMQGQELTPMVHYTTQSLPSGEQMMVIYDGSNAANGEYRPLLALFKDRASGSWYLHQETTNSFDINQNNPVGYANKQLHFQGRNDPNVPQLVANIPPLDPNVGYTNLIIDCKMS